MSTPASPAQGTINRSPLANHLHPIFRAAAARAYSSGAVAGTSGTYSFGDAEDGVYIAIDETNKTAGMITITGGASAVSTVALAGSFGSRWTVTVPAGALQFANTTAGDSTLLVFRLATLAA